MLCRIGEILQHYLLLANYFWIFIEGWVALGVDDKVYPHPHRLYLNNILTFSIFQEHSGIHWYILGGWTPPVVIVAIWAVAKALSDPTDKCWSTLIYTDPLFWIIRAPITIAIFVSDESC